MHRQDAASHLDKRIILIGAGHAHLLFIRMWAMQRRTDVSVTLINESPTVPYSAMVPGVIGGDYSRDEATIDLVRLCQASGVRLISEPVTRIETSTRTIHFSNRPSLSYEVLSLGLGSRPGPPQNARQIEHSYSVRPLAALMERLDILEAELKEAPRPFKFTVVGAGASGCELALAIRRRYSFSEGFQVSIIHAGDRLLPGFTRSAAKLFENEFASAGVRVRLNSRVIAGTGAELQLDSGERVQTDAVLWATDPIPPPVLQQSDLPCDSQGYFQVRPTLQSIRSDDIFGTGDCVSIAEYPDLPRNGVMAVREGRILFKNVIAVLDGRTLSHFRPPRLWLSLLNTANGSAVASFGSFVSSGRWLRRWKNRIDRRWIAMFDPSQTMTMLLEMPMRCGGCGSKVPGDVLASALKRLNCGDDPRVLAGCHAAEDAAVFDMGHEETVELQTVDYFKTFLDDPYLFGKVAALHSLSDLDAMNAKPFAALALVTLPPARSTIQTEQLNELMTGATEIFRELKVVLAGGQTVEGPELSLGFAVTGHGQRDRLFRKGGLIAGDVLILTKALGTGAILAGWAQGQCRAEWFESLRTSMLSSNSQAAKVFDSANVTGCTDVTGFGLAGHLLEMLDQSKVSAELFSKEIPVLPGFEEAVSSGVVSTLQESNARIGCRIIGHAGLPAWLFDPQTSGGLLAGVKEELAATTLERLEEAGYPNARIIGRVTALEGDEPTLTLR